MKLIIVEDEPDLMTAFTDIAESMGFDVETAPNGKEGLSKINSQPPFMFPQYAVLSDCDMPHVSGGELMDKTRARRQQQRLRPPYWIGATAGTDVASDSYLQRCDFALKKPFHLNELQQALNEAQRFSPQLENVIIVGSDYFIDDMKYVRRGEPECNAYERVEAIPIWERPDLVVIEHTTGNARDTRILRYTPKTCHVYMIGAGFPETEGSYLDARLPCIFNPEDMRRALKRQRPPSE
ncbi:MAG: response regulator [Candidatus Aenigmarchaeota archaeon]|nr:response regulator [Candidatus Aenigmarchaeota archaeon]